jgi:hypothetical protein
VRHRHRRTRRRAPHPVRQPPRIGLPALLAGLQARGQQLVRAGLTGGKGVPGTVAAHPCVWGPDGLLRSAPHTFTDKADASKWLALTDAEVLGGRWTGPDAGRVPFAE